MTLLGHYAAAPRCQAVQGNRLYAVFGDELLIYNISSQTQPTLLGRGFFRTERVEDIRVSGTTVFLAGAGSGLVAIDASTPSAPVELDRISMAGGERAMNIEVEGSRVYADDCGHLHILNAANPSNLAEIGSIDYDSGASSCRVQSFDVEGTTLFLATETGVEIVDIANASNPVTIATYRNNTAFAMVKVESGLMAAWNENTSVLHLVDVQTPAFPSQYSTFTEHAEQIEIDPTLNLLYMRDDEFNGTDNVFLWEITNPSSPRAQGLIPGETFDIDVSGDNAIVSRYEGIELWDTANPNQPLEVWTVSGGYADVRALDADHRHLAAVADSGTEYRVAIYDVSTPGVLTPIANLSLPNDNASLGTSVFVRTPYVYVTGNSLHVLDLEAPGGPQFVGVVTPPELLYGSQLQVWENLAVAATVGNELSVFDVSNPQSPTFLGAAAANVGGSLTGVAIGPGVAYLATTTNIAAFSLSDPANPFLAFQLGVAASAISLTGTTLVVERDYFISLPMLPEIRLYFVPDPLTAILTGTYTESVFNPNGIDARGDRLSFFDDSGHQSHVSLLDISDPQNPSEIDRVQTNARCMFLSLTPDRIWRAEYAAGDSTGTWEYGLGLPPEIVEQPASIRSCQPGFKQFRVDASGAPTYRWRRNGVDLNNGATGSGSIIAGAFSAILTIFSAGPADNASYDCVVTNACGQVTTTAATLFLCNGCAQDIDCNCQIDIQDLAILLAHFGTTSGATFADGDLDGDGDVEIQDLATLLSRFGVLCQ